MEPFGGGPPRRVDYRENRLSRSLRPSSAVFPHFLSRSLHNVHTESIGIPSWGASVSQAHLPQVIEDEEKRLDRVESRPVLRRRRFKHRKSVNLEQPDTSAILARGVVESSSEEEEESPRTRIIVPAFELDFQQRDQRTTEPEYEPTLRGPSARRFNRRNQQRAHLSMHCLPISERSIGQNGPPSAFSAVARRGEERKKDETFHRSSHLPTTLNNSFKAQSMADLQRGFEDGEDSLDFSSQASVSRWTSRIFAELESLPGSMMDINESTQSINRLGPSAGTVSMTSSTMSIIDPHVLASSMTSDLDNRSTRSSTLTYGDTVSSRLAESINNLDQLLMKSSTLSLGSAAPLDLQTSPDDRPPVPPHRSTTSIYIEDEGSSGMNSIGTNHSESSRLSILSIKSCNTDASGETLKIDDDDTTSRLPRSDLVLNFDSTSQDSDRVELETGSSKDIAAGSTNVEEDEIRTEIDQSQADFPPKQQKPKRHSVLEDDKYPLLQSIYRLSQSMRAETLIVDEKEEERIERWQRTKKVSCVDRLSTQQRASKVASTPSIDTPPPSVEHVVLSLLRAAKKSERKDAVTQTSPVLSRSSSFDWLETDSVVSAVPSTPLSLRRDESSSGEDAADREVRAVNSAASARKMRLDATMDESLALLHMMTKDSSEQSIPSLNSRASRLSRDSRALRSSTIVAQSSITTTVTAASVTARLQPAPVAATRSTASSAMSESVYDNVHSERSRDEEDDDDDEILSVTSAECSNPTGTSGMKKQIATTQSVPHEYTSSRTSTLINETALPSTSHDNSVPIKWTLSKAEEKATEACRWLRSAGFPQYAHAYEEGSFPIQLESVISDHSEILDTDSIHALSKRIATLNRCAIMRMDGVVLRDRSSLISDQMNNMHSDEDGIALSGNWRYQRNSQTWARIADSRSTAAGSPHHTRQLLQPYMQQPQRPIDVESTNREGTRNSMLQRSHSERIKERAKAIMKKMDVRQIKQKKEPAPMVISDPVLLSYDTASPPSMRMFPTGQAARIPVNGQRAHGFISPPPARSKSSHTRRQGIVFASHPSSPESSDDATQLRLSRYGEAAPIRSLTRLTSRDRSVPSRLRDSIDSHHRLSRAEDLPQPHHRFSRVGSGDVEPQNRFSRVGSGDAEHRPLRAERLPSKQDYLYPRNRAVMSTSSASSARRALDTSMTSSSTSSLPYATPPFERRRLGVSTSAAPAPSPLFGALHGASPDFDERRMAPAHSPHLLDSRLNVETRGSNAESDGEQEERRDSGAGSSLSRSPSSNPCTLRIRQSVITPPTILLSMSFSSSTTSSTSTWSRRPEAVQTMIPTSTLENFFTEAQLPNAVDALSVNQLILYRKTCYGRLTGVLEKHMCGRGGMINIEDETTGGQSSRLFSSSVHKLLKRITNGESKTVKESHAVFGIALSEIRRRYGTCLPHCVSEIIRYLRGVAPDAVGIFRKNGVKSRINELKVIADTERDGDIFQEENAFSASQVHDVADLLKQYLRELPDPLMTTKLSKTFANIFEHLPANERLTNLRYAIVLLPPEHREALQTLLFFFHDVASHSATNNMSADNIAVCLTPSLFHLSASRLNSVTPSRRHKTIGGTGMPTEAEMSETKAAQNCLATMITNVGELFIVSRDDLTRMEGERKADHEPDFPLVNALSGFGAHGYLVNKINDLVAEHDERWRGWIVDGSHDGVEMSSKKSTDGQALKHFRVWTDIEAPPKELLKRIKDKRIVWDESFLCQRTMDNGPDYDVFQYVLNDSPGHPTRDFFVVRLAVPNLSNLQGASALVERSVKCSETQLLGGVSAAVLESKWLIEPYSQGRSRVTYLSRVDLRGRCPSWYNHQYGFVMARCLARLRESYKHRHENAGPETKI